MLGHYKLIELIGRGGMGVVYRAIDTSLGPVGQPAAEAVYPAIATSHGVPMNAGAC